MVDHVKSALLKRLRGQEPRRNPQYVDFAKHMGGTMAPCNVGKGHEKGRGEPGVGYGKHNCLAGLALPPFRALNPAATHWLDTVAKGRSHGETRQPPVAL
jgi:transposase